MNDLPTPIDSELRRQLDRRSAGRIPDGLLAEVSTALDAARPPLALVRRPRTIWRAPRLALAGMGAALVVVLAVAIALPGFRGGPATAPAGYPTDRALTTAELADYLAGSPVTNATIVATVTIEARPDVCPMNSRPTIGVVAGLDTQVCVIGATASDYLKQTAGSGTFAFRYMAQGYLGLIGEVTPASPSRLAFNVTGDWPTTGKAFLADGYLGAMALPCDATLTFEIGDILNPSGYEPCRSSWLSEDGSAAPTTAAPSLDMLALHEKARFVTAGGARQIDSIPSETTHGVFVVRPATGACPGASAVDSRGCSTWQVLARVADISLPEASPTPPPTAARLTGYPSDRALTAGELAGLMSGPTLATNTTFVATVTIDKNMNVCPMNRAPTIGVIEAMASQVCAMDLGSGVWPAKVDRLTGTYVFQYWAPGYLGLLREVTPASASQLAFRVGDTVPSDGSFLVDGWLQRSNLVGNDPALCLGQTPDPFGNLACANYRISATEAVAPAGSTQAGLDVTISDLYPSPAPGHGVFLVSSSGLALVARLDDDPFAAVAGPTADPAPTSTAPASPFSKPTPTPLVLPTSPPGAAPLGLWGQGNRPFTVAELPALYAADPDHLAGRIVIVKGPVPAEFLCWSAGQADAGISPPPCHIGVEPSQIAADGHYWAIKIGADGKLSILGELVVPSTGGFSFTGDLANQTERLRDQGLVIVVDGWLSEVTYDSCSHPETPPPNNCRDSKVTGTAPLAADDLIDLQPGGYRAITGNEPDVTAAGPPVRGFFLVLVESPQRGTILTQLSPVQP